MSLCVRSSVVSRAHCCFGSSSGVDSTIMGSVEPDVRYDTDGNGLSNVREVELSTNPSDADSDGIADSRELGWWETDPTLHDYRPPEVTVTSARFETPSRSSDGCDANGRDTGETQNGTETLTKQSNIAAKRLCRDAVEAKTGSKQAART